MGATKGRQHPGRTAKVLNHVEPHPAMELIHVLQDLLRFFARETGVPLTRLVIFHELAHAGDRGLGITALAEKAGVTPAFITRQAQEMEEEGLVRRKKDARDGRRSSVLLTARGWGQVLAIHERVHEGEAGLFAEVPPNDLAAALRVLAALDKAMSPQARKGGIAWKPSQGKK
jgi:DNA-binding MarR family transcriptional regulator